MNELEIVEKADKLKNIFGRWPSFHDGKVLLIERLEQKIKIKFHVFEMTNEVNPQGYYVLKNHTQITLLFDDVQNANVNNLEYPVTIFGLDIEKNQPELIKVEFTDVYTNTVKFTCSRIEVLSVEPFPDIR